MDDEAVEGGIGAEPARGLQQVRERLPLFQLIDGGPEHGTRDLHAPPVQRDVHDVAGLETNAPTGVAAQQVIVEIQRCRQRVQATDLDPPHVGAGRDTAGGIQGGETRAQRADLERARLVDFARHIHLAHTHIGHGDVESRPRARPALDPRIHPPQTRHQHVPQLLERQVGNKNLPDLGNQDEPLSCHRKAVRQLDTAGEYEDQLVSRSQLVVRREWLAS